MHLQEIKKAKDKISNVINKTPLLYSSIFSKNSNNKVYMKCENLQITGAYKIRGALNKISSLTDSQKINGVVCSSAGNHAQGVAYASSLYGVKSTIVMPKSTPYIKVQATRDLKGKVVLFGDCYDDAYKEAKRIEAEEEAFFIHPFNDIQVIYGQGTIALEILEEINDIDVIICPIGGGGLISGIALAAKSINPKIKIIGVQAEGANAMEKSFKLKRLTQLSSINTIADGIAVKSPGNITFEIISEYVDEIITVSDKEIVDAFLLLVEKNKLLVEPSGAVSLAALNKINISGKKIVSVISGGNIDMLTISTLINHGLVEGGRLFCFSIELPNSPGELLKISEILSTTGANIVKIEHNHVKATNHLRNVLLEITIETNGHNHINMIKEAFNKSNFKLNCKY